MKRARTTSTRPVGTHPADSPGDGIARKIDVGFLARIETLSKHFIGRIWGPGYDPKGGLV